MNKNNIRKFDRALSGIKVEKRIHKGWTEWDNARRNMEFKKSHPIPLFGKYHYIYSSPKGTISLVKINEGSYGSYLRKYRKDFISAKNYWEIYCLDGDIFYDVVKFKSKKQAENKIIELINGK